MLAQDRASRGQNLISALRDARRTWWRRAFVDAASLAVLAASLVVLAAWVRSWLAGEPGRLLVSGGLHPASVVVMAAAGFSVAVIAAAVRSPSLLEIARRVDRSLGQSERFSTTYEVISGGGPSNVVTGALVSEVEDRAGGLDVGPAGWARGYGGLGRLAAASVAVAVVLLSVPVPARSLRVTGSQASGPQVTSPRSSAADAATLAGVAQLLDLVAEQEDSDYLRALAASFSDLADRVSSNAASSAETERAAQELAEHLQAASQEVGGAFAQAVEAAFAPSPGQSSAADAMQPADAGAPGAPAPPEPSAPPAAAPANQSVADPSADFYRSLSALMDQFEEDPAGVGVRPQRSAQSDPNAASSLYGGVLEAQTDPNAAPAEATPGARVDGPAGGAPVGAAERSDDSAGDAAGRGGADLGAGSAAFLDLDAQAGAVAALPRNEREDGQFVEMELVPQADPAAAAGPGGPAGAPPAFVRSEEAAFTSRGIGAEHAGVVSRYFTPDSVPTGDPR